MRHKYRIQKFQTTALMTAALLFAFGASQAYAFDAPTETASNDASISKTTVMAKTALTANPPVLRAPVIRVTEDLPQAIIPLNTDYKTSVSPDVTLERSYDLTEEETLQDAALMQDGAFFIGAPERSEFDSLDRQLDRAAMPEGTFVQPLYTVAGAGLSTTF